MLPWTLLDECYQPAASRRPSFACPRGGWKPASVAKALQNLLDQPRGRELAKKRVVGHSVEGRPIELVEVGTGPKRVLAWSQMHGNEPTHTTALLELLWLFTADRDSHPLAEDLERLLEEICQRCTLGLVVMLNPDGAQRNIRFNAHGVDINRDARRLAAPESRVLKTLVETFKPEFGLNLHNQHHRTATAVGNEPSAVSLLAPPRAEGDPQTPSTKKAAQLAALLSERLSTHCDGRLSRYDADYMPRAFGEWVQGQDVATVLIEAGGWPEGEFGPLDRLHLFALLTAFDAIATGEYQQTDSQTYVELTRSGEFDLYDRVLRNAKVHFNPGETPSQIDIGINLPTRAIDNPQPAGGVVVDLGDLSVHGSVDELQPHDNPTALPGHWQFVADLNPGNDLSETEDKLLAQGVTTVIGAVDLADKAQLAALEQEPLAARYRLNRGMIATLSDPNIESARLRERLLRAIASGVLGIASNLLTTKDDTLPIIAERYRLPVIDLKSLAKHDEPVSHVERFAASRNLATSLGLAGRHTIARGGRADLLLLDGSLEETANLQLVLVGGTVGGTSPLAGDRLCRWHAR